MATALFPAIQLFTLPDIADRLALFSQFLGLAALILMAWGQILSTRFAGMETVFGGLDRVYVLHKWAGIAAMAAILLHDTIDADMEGLGAETALTDFAETLGEISLYGLLILVVISVATFIPYHLWKWTHKAMGAFFAAGAIHFFLILKPFAMTDPAGLYTAAFCVAGLVAYGWTLVPQSMRPSHAYEIAGLEPSGDALAVSLKPVKSGIRPEPGQFGVLQFIGAGLDEPHPFSFSAIEKDGGLRVTVKPLGDFTHRLPGRLQAGQSVAVQGPYGRFRHSGTGPEIWVAGGIGITPFLAWARALDETRAPVDLFYCVRSPETAPHLAEIEQIAASKDNLTLHVMASSQGDRLSADRIVTALKDRPQAQRLSFCGPVSLRQALQKDLHRLAITPRNFHYEEFEFRTGIGLKRLAGWLLERAQR